MGFFIGYKPRCFPRKYNLLMFFRSARSREQKVFEVTISDLVIDANTGEILELHIPVSRGEEKELLKFLIKTGLINNPTKKRVKTRNVQL